MKIVELAQGSIDLSGLTLEEALLRLIEGDDRFLEKFPHLRATYRPSWRAFETTATDGRAPWGHEWWGVGVDGRLYLHSADYDSSG